MSVVHSSYDGKKFKIHPDIISLDEHNEITGIIETEPRLVNYQVYSELFLVDSKFCVQILNFKIKCTPVKYLYIQCHIKFIEKIVERQV